MSTLKLHLLLAVLLIIAISMQLVRCQDEEEGGGGDDEEEPEKTCQQYIFGLLQQALPKIPNCLTGNNRLKLRFRTPFEPLSRAYVKIQVLTIKCIVKCILSELEVLDATGVLDEVNALFFFQEAVPPHVLPAIVDVAGPCLEMASTLKPNEYYCQSYGPFTQCLINALVKGMAPWALDCFATPAFGGIFGMLNFVVPPVTPSAGGERKRLISPKYNSTVLLQRMKEIKRQKNLLAVNNAKNVIQNNIGNAYNS